MAYFGKEYTFEKEENFEAFIAALELSSDTSTKYLKFKPNQKLEKDGDSYKLVIILPEGNKEIPFKVGESFDEVVIGNLKAKSIVTVDGDTFTQVQDFGDKGVITFKREYSANALKTTMTFSKWDGVATRWYTAV